MKQTVTPLDIHELLKVGFPDDSDGIIVSMDVRNPGALVIDFTESELLVVNNKQKMKPKQPKSVDGERIIDNCKIFYKYQVDGQWFDEFEDANPENNFLGTIVDARYLNTTLEHMSKTEKHIKDMAIGGISAIVALILTMTTLFLFIWGVF